MNSKKFYPESVAGVVFNEERTAVLLIKRRDVPVWVLPGGGVEPGESPKAAILREFLEETGLTVKIKRLIGDYFPINRLTRTTQLFECTWVSGSLSLSDETRDIAFFALHQLPLLIPPPYLEWLEDARKVQPPLKKSLNSVTYSALLINFLRHPLLVIRFILARIGLRINTQLDQQKSKNKCKESK